MRGAGRGHTVLGEQGLGSIPVGAWVGGEQGTPSLMAAHRALLPARSGPGRGPPATNTTLRTHKAPDDLFRFAERRPPPGGAARGLGFRPGASRPAAWRAQPPEVPPAGGALVVAMETAWDAVPEEGGLQAPLLFMRRPEDALPGRMCSRAAGAWWPQWASHSVPCAHGVPSWPACPVPGGQGSRLCRAQLLGPSS